MTFTIKKWKKSSAEAELTKCFLFEPSGRVSLLGLLLIALLCSHFESAEGVLVQTPTNTIVIANHSTFFNCSKSFNESGELTWSHYSLDGKLSDVYEDGKIRGTYKGRFYIDTNSLTSGTFNLLVQEPEPKDAGRYECVENRLKKDKGASAELTVLDSNLVCKSDKDLSKIVGPTDCVKPIAPDQLHLSCSVTYSGNITPQMQWGKVDSKLQSIETKCGVSGNSVMCNATQEVNLNMDGSVYICQIITAEHYNCSLEVNKTIYIFPDTLERAYTTTEEAFCFANTSVDLPCLYNWHKGNKIEHFGQTLKPNTTGIYRCEAECTIRNETCAFTATVINVSEPEASNAGLIAGLTVGLLFIIGVSIFVAIMARRRHTNMKKENGKNSETVELVDPKKDSSLPNIVHQDKDNLIQQIRKDPFLYKGLNDNIFGPLQYKGNVGLCACEKIMVSSDQQNIKNKDGLTAVDKIINNGSRWQNLKHRNLIKIHNIIFEESAVYIVTEYATGSSVERALKDRARVLLIQEVKDWATQIAKGLQYLHQNGIIHKNIKTAQIYIMEEPNESSSISGKTLKIGCNNFLENDGASFKENEAYWAPEVIKGQTHSEKSDLWSFSVVVWELLTGSLPKNVSSEKITKDLENLNLRHKELRKILLDCRCVKPLERPTSIELLDRLEKWQVEDVVMGKD